MLFKDYYTEANFSMAAATSVGKKESREQEFAKLSSVLKASPKSTINVLSLPFAYEYEKDLSIFTGKKVVSFGVEKKLLKSVKSYAKQAAATGMVVPYLILEPADIDEVIQNPDAYNFHRITRHGVSPEKAKLHSNLDIIDLDYLGFPSLYPPGYRGKKEDSYLIVNRAAHLLRPGGILCVTFMLYGMFGMNYLDLIKKADPVYHSLLDINKPGPEDYFKKDNPDPQHYAVTKLKSDVQGPSAKHRYKKLATAANEYINQIIRDDAGVDLSLLWSNIYKGGAANTSIMWRGVFIKS